MTLHELIEQRKGKGIDIYDSIIDSGVYVEYKLKGGDDYDKALRAMANEIEVVELRDDCVICNAHGFFEKHKEFFDDEFGYDDTDDLVECGLSPIFSGSGTFATYSKIAKYLQG